MLFYSFFLPGVAAIDIENGVLDNLLILLNYIFSPLGDMNIYYFNYLVQNILKFIAKDKEK